MAVDDRMTHLTRDAQRRLFRLAERDHGLSLKAIGLDGNIPYSTLRTYASGEAIMPVPAVLKLVDVLPDYLLSYLFEPAGRLLTVKDGEDGDLDELGREAAGFVAEYVDAKSDGKVTPIENARLRQRAMRLNNSAAKVAGGGA